MITLSLGQLVTSAQTGALRKFFSLGKPVAKYFGNRKLSRECDIELKAWNELLDATRKRFGVEVKDGALVIPEGAADEFNKEIDALLAKKLPLEGMPVLASDLVGSLTDEEMISLEPFIAAE